MSIKRATISVLVENEFGVLTRVAGLFSGRGYNIECLSVAETLDPTVSRITLVTAGDEKIISQIVKQLNKLVPVLHVEDVSSSPHVEREVALIRVRADKDTRAEAMRLVDLYRGKIVDAAADTILVEITGEEEEIRAVIELLTQVGIIEIARSGKVALKRARGLAEAEAIPG